ncbi:hypothetical protein PI27_gp016 [Listeria phage WIL-1]|nr:hypothetical protein PI27_gp016 [Listeria phage WIL-1]
MVGNLGYYPYTIPAEATYLGQVSYQYKRSKN